jgi:hypothetical protein
MAGRVLIGLIGAGLLAVPAPAGAAGGFLAGAGIETTSPPAVGSPADHQFGPPSLACPSSLYPLRGRFGLQEPFSDSGHDGQWDPGDRFCDANANGRWDGIYADNGNGPAGGVHDPIDVRAIAISDGRHRPVVYASVDQIGIFDYYTDQARADLAHTYRVRADLVVSADHNESSPDSIGLYGALQTPVGVGLRSGIDEYYMRFLEDRIAHAAADAVHALRPASLYAIQVKGLLPSGASGHEYPLLTGMSQRISDQFPTSVALPHDDRVAAVDTKMGVVQARDPTGQPIFTVMSLAAHNQEMGNSGAALSADWPGAFEHAFDETHPGVAMFLVADNGSEEDPQTSPTVIPKGSENHSSVATQYIQARATGERFAAIVSAVVRGAQRLAPGPVTLIRRQICVPLENNGFLALAAAGEFGLRQGYVCDASGRPLFPIPNGSILPTASTEFRTYLSFADIGPDLQLIDNPGEAFPALMLGSPFGVEEESCNRPNPAVPTWHARAPFRLQVGLADDLIGYLVPAWGFASGTPGLFNNDLCSQDMNGHGHKLESESVGPTGANDVANGLAAMLDSFPDQTAHFVRGRFVLADGSYSRWPTGAAGMLLADNVLIGAPGTAGFGHRAVDKTGVFMDYDGQPQRAPDITTRGMMVLGGDGCVLARYYLDVFPSLAGRQPLGREVPEPRVTPPHACPTDELQQLAAAGAGLRVSGATARLARRAGPFAVRHHRAPCTGRLRPPRLEVARHGLHGRALGLSCGARIARVMIRRRGSSLALLANGTSSWSSNAPGGHYTITAVDTNGLTTVDVT